MANLVLIRHGQSIWNLENRFTGWVDVDLSDQGVKEATEAGQLLKKHQMLFDHAFSSVLKRAIRTLWITLHETNQHFLPTVKNYKLNERHYGALTGLNKAETAQLHGDEKVKIWRRSFATPPPSMDSNHPFFKVLNSDRRYQELAGKLPLGESLKNTIERVLPFWESDMAPLLKKDKKLLVVAHGNSLRALIKHLDGLSDEQIMQEEIPTGKPLAYQLESKTLKALSRAYLD